MDQEMVKLAGQYAELAETLLQKQGQRYTDEDIIKVANYLIDQDYPDLEKTAEEELAEIRTAAFYDELEKNAFWQKLVGGAKTVGKAIHGGAENIGFHTSRALMNKKLPKWMQDAGYWAGQNMHATGYALGGAGALGAGYGIKKALD